MALLAQRTSIITYSSVSERNGVIHHGHQNTPRSRIKFRSQHRYGDSDTAATNVRHPKAVAKVFVKVPSSKTEFWSGTVCPYFTWIISSCQIRRGQQHRPIISLSSPDAAAKSCSAQIPSEDLLLHQTTMTLRLYVKLRSDVPGSPLPRPSFNPCEV